MYQVKIYDNITRSWKSCLTCPYAQAVDLFDDLQRKARSGEVFKYEFIDVEITAIKLVELGPEPDYRERNVLNYTEIKRKK